MPATILNRLANEIYRRLVTLTGSIKISLALPITEQK